MKTRPSNSLLKTGFGGPLRPGAAIPWIVPLLKTGFLLFILLLPALLGPACMTSRLVRSLDPDSRDFLSKVRYLITRQERNIFLNIPAEERRAFIEEFWKKRDPTPDTEENEFKDEYFQRIQEANHLFGAGGGGEPGWLQDRGRIYILLGPPDNRETYPRGVTFYGVPTEYWYYGFFPITFIDEFWTGNYRLDPDSAIQLVEIMKSQLFWKPEVPAFQGVLDCKAEVSKPAKGKALLRISLPYRKIWFKDEGEKISAVLRVEIDARNDQGRIIWVFDRDYPLSLTAARLEEIGKKDYVIDVPVDVPAGKYWINLTLRNSADSAKVSKRVPLDL